MDKEAIYLNRPRILDGSNYDMWKPRMAEYIKSLDSRAWKDILKGWTHPVIVGADNQPTGELKPKENWSKEDDELALANSKDLNSIFGGVDRNIFRLINTCEVAKDDWEILKTTHEGNSKVKMSKLQLLTSKFENMIMKEEKAFNNFI